MVSAKPLGARRVLNIRRERTGDTFTYILDGSAITDSQLIERIEKLAIPPAWTDVRISESASAKVCARGVDNAGRTQTIYHPRFRRKQEQLKFDRITRFAAALPRLRQQVQRDLRRRKMSQEKVVACIVKLMDEQFFRVGNSRYAVAHESFGITTLRRKHVETTRSAVTFDFVGKSGKRHRRTVKDAQIVRLVTTLNEMPRYEIFRFLDDENVVHNVRSQHVNDYLKQHMGEEFSAKDFRTWGGTVLAISGLLSATHQTNGEDKKQERAAQAKILRDVVAEVADALGNTTAITRASYIHPRVLQAAEDPNALVALSNQRAKIRKTKFFSVDEQATLGLLEQ